MKVIGIVFQTITFRVSAHATSTLLLFMLVFSHFAAGQDAIERCILATMAFNDDLVMGAFFGDPFSMARFLTGKEPPVNSKNDYTKAVERAKNGCIAQSVDGPCNRIAASKAATTNPDYSRFSPTDLKLNSQSCVISDSVSEVTGRDDSPYIGSNNNPFRHAFWMARLRMLLRQQQECEKHNGGKNKFTDGGPKSPYGSKLDDLADSKWWLEMMGEAHSESAKEFDRYLKDHCHQKEIEAIMGIFGNVTCGGERGESAITVKRKSTDSPAGLLANMFKQIGSGSIFYQNTSFHPVRSIPAETEWYLISFTDVTNSPIVNMEEKFYLGNAPTTLPSGFLTPASYDPQKSYNCPIYASCSECCTDSEFKNTAYVYGGPNQSIRVGEIENPQDVKVTCSPDIECGKSVGDPHICTHDGLWYEFQGAGEFVLAKTEDFEAQARYQPYGLSRYVSFNTAMAARFGDDRVGLYAGDPTRLLVNGEEMFLEPNVMIKLESGLVIRRDKDYRNTDWIKFSKGGYAVEATPGEKRLGIILVRVPEDTESGGLFGNRNNNTRDDIWPLGGKPLVWPVGFNTMYRDFGNSWRVTEKTSLFDYAEGESVETFVDVEFPDRWTSLKHIGSAARNSAETVCRNAGVENGINLENCIYDITMTGDENFAMDALYGRKDGVRLEMVETTPGMMAGSTTDGIWIELPTEQFASFPVEISLKGPVPEGFYIIFAELGGSADSRVNFPYSHYQTKGGDGEITIPAPYQPGEYELRLIDGRNRVLLSIPNFRSIVPKIVIGAPETAEASDSIDVLLYGDLSPNAGVHIVQAGSPDERMRPLTSGRAAHQGFFDKIRVRAPDTPGEYEIRFTTSGAFGETHTVYARKKLTIR